MHPLRKTRQKSFASVSQMHSDRRALQAIAVLGYPPVLFPIENEWLILGPQPRDDLVPLAGASAVSGKRSRGRNETFAWARSFLDPRWPSCN